jgi:hypothetical protein
MNNQGVYNLTFGFCNNDKPLSKEVKLKILKVKFLNGETHYDNDEIEMLKTWLDDSGPEEMRELFEKHVLAESPLKANAYKKSVLQKIFRDLIPAV